MTIFKGQRSHNSLREREHTHRKQEDLQSKQIVAHEPLTILSCEADYCGANLEITENRLIKARKILFIKESMKSVKLQLFVCEVFALDIEVAIQEFKRSLC